MDSQYIRHHMAKQMLNANISPSIFIDMNVEYVYGLSGAAQALTYVMFTWWLNLIKSISGQNMPNFAKYFLAHASINPRNSRSNRDYTGNDRQWVLLQLFEIIAKVMDL